MIMQFLTHYSKLLNLLKNKFNLNWNNITSLFNVDPLKTKYIAESFSESMTIRERIINLVKEDKLDETLKICKDMVNILQKALTS